MLRRIASRDFVIVEELDVEFDSGFSVLTGETGAGKSILIDALQLALGADIRIAHPDTKLSVRELHWGITPDMTGTFMLTRLVRNDVARELTYTARVFDAREGYELGLVTRLSDQPYDDAMALAREIAGRNPDGVRGAKRLFNRMFTAGAAEQFADERHVIASLIGTPNQVEAISANVEGRAPRFTAD